MLCKLNFKTFKNYVANKGCMSFLVAKVTKEDASVMYLSKGRKHEDIRGSSILSSSACWNKYR